MDPLQHPANVRWIAGQRMKKVGQESPTDASAFQPDTQASDGRVVKTGDFSVEASPWHRHGSKWPPRAMRGEDRRTDAERTEFGHLPYSGFIHALGQRSSRRHVYLGRAFGRMGVLPSRAMHGTRLCEGRSPARARFPLPETISLVRTTPHIVKELARKSIADGRQVTKHRTHGNE